MFINMALLELKGNVGLFCPFLLTPDNRQGSYRADQSEVPVSSTICRSFSQKRR